MTHEAWILTHCGRHLDLERPDPETIDIEDIAVGLSRECRFAGQPRAFYSVAQHSVLASRIVPDAFALEALLHDATEAFIRDLPYPLKTILPEYRRIERGLDRAIRLRFGLPETLSREVHLADRILLATEKRDLMPVDPVPWDILEGVEPLSDPIDPWSSVRAMGLFLHRFRKLTGHGVGRAVQSLT
ncbi:hypothetical protein [Leptospirillum ferriphilum]|uniref:hypothetical protein n=1 Tax=Leptospirillum ferriphilum TaxID=178606 RepID=UPI000985F6AD|nr:hypothetical protein [Leptospirillum ferriphilum]OOH77740.1 hypothetical protein BOX30_09150 [Leptospirillum ferriphilum]